MASAFIQDQRDVDPLQESVAPRYAVESDEEDEVNPLRPVASPTPIDVQIRGDIQQGVPLVIASGEIAAIWAKGAQLGEQIAAVFVNNVQVGLTFRPTWTQSTVIVSEVLCRLPLSFQHPYSVKILESFSPSTISLLDSYSASTYSSPSPTRILEAPLRYLSTGQTPLSGKVAHFEPPNLLQSASASVLTLASIQSIPATVLLVPSSQTPHPAPKELSISNFSSLSSHESNEQWNSAILKEVHRLLFLAVNEQITEEWQSKHNNAIAQVKSRRTELGEGGMYL